MVRANSHIFFVSVVDGNYAEYGISVFDETQQSSYHEAVAQSSLEDVVGWEKVGVFCGVLRIGRWSTGRVYNEMVPV